MALFLRKLLPKQIPHTITNLSTIHALRTSSSTSSANPSDDAKQDPNTPIFDMPNPFTKEKLKCILCEHGIDVNYKNVKLLSQFQSSYTGRVYGRHITGLCKAQQARVEKEIVKAQSAGLMGYYYKDPHFLRDPELFDPERPIRPHRF